MASLVISCHGDTGFLRHTLRHRKGGILHGHLDNFGGVHAVMRAFFTGRLSKAPVRIEVTYDEEVDLTGACEVAATLKATDTVIVVDVTGVPTEKDLVVEKCADPQLRRLVEEALEGMDYDLYEGCEDPISDEDEVDVYREVTKRSCMLCLPVWGGDYNEGTVSCRASSIDALTEAICRMAERYPAWARRLARRRRRPKSRS